MVVQISPRPRPHRIFFILTEFQGISDHPLFRYLINISHHFVGSESVLDAKRSKRCRYRSVVERPLDVHAAGENI